MDEVDTTTTTATKVAWRFQSEENMAKYREYQREYQKNYYRIRAHQPRPDKKTYYEKVVKPAYPYHAWAKRLMKMKL